MLVWLRSIFRFGVFGHQHMFFVGSIVCLERCTLCSICLGEVFDWSNFLALFEHIEFGSIYYIFFEECH